MPPEESCLVCSLPVCVGVSGSGLAAPVAVMTTANTRITTATTQTTRPLMCCYYETVKMSVSVGLFFSSEEEAEAAQEVLGSMVGSVHRPASQ